MAVDSKLTEWEADFTGSDTNTPTDSSVIGELGKEYRSIKAIVLNDLSNNRDVLKATGDGTDAMTYDSDGYPEMGADTTDNNVITTGRGIGKGYAVYKAGETEDIHIALPDQFGGAPTSRETWAFGYPRRSGSGVYKTHIWVEGDWTSVIYPGTKICLILGDSTTEAPNTETNKNHSCTLSVFNTAYHDDKTSIFDSGKATLVTFHPPLQPYPTKYENSKMSAVADTLVFKYIMTADGSPENATTSNTWDWLHVETDDMSEDDAKRFTISGRRLEFCELTKVTNPRGGALKPLTDANYTDGVHYSSGNILRYKERSWTVIVGGNAPKVFDGDADHIYIPIYKYAWQIASYVDGFGADGEGTASNPVVTADNTNAKARFGATTRAYSGFGNWANDAGDRVAHTYGELRNGLDNTDSQYYMIRASDPYYFQDHSHESNKVVDNAKLSEVNVLIGTQTGNLELNGAPQEVVTFSVFINGADDLNSSNQAEILFPNDGIKGVASPLGGGAASYKGEDYRVEVTAKNLPSNTSEDDATYSATLNSVMNPEVMMNLWSTTTSDWDSVDEKRSVTSVLFEYDGTWQGIVEYDVQIVTPYSNGNTLYKTR